MVIKKSNLQDPLSVIKDSAQDIWLAGLGAFSTANEEGSKLFQQLVKKGASVQKENKVLISELTERVSSFSDGAKDAAKDAYKNLSAPVEAGLTNAMHRLGVPTRAEIVNLTKRVEELTKAVAKTKTAAETKAPARSTAKPKAKTASSRA